MAGGFVANDKFPSTDMYLFDAVQEKAIGLIEEKYPQIL